MIEKSGSFIFLFLFLFAFFSFFIISGIALQGGCFDWPDRLFTSIPTSWKLASHDFTDVRELIPEFYYFPEFLKNLNSYDFGITQDKIRVVRLFVSLH